MIIYKVTNKANGKQYVGTTINSFKRRIWEHLSIKYSGTVIFSRAIKKYGKESFIFEQIDAAATRKELLEKESFWIKELNTLHPNGYNFLKDSTGSEIAKPRRVPIICVEDDKEYSSAAEAAKKYRVPPASIYSVCSGRTDFTGDWSFKYVDLKKREIAEKRKNERKKSAAKGYRAGYEKTKKPIKCVETGVIYDSGISAGKMLNIRPTMISRVCQGKAKHTGGLTFIYVK